MFQTLSCNKINPHISYLDVTCVLSIVAGAIAITSSFRGCTCSTTDNFRVYSCSGTYLYTSTQDDTYSVLLHCNFKCVDTYSHFTRNSITRPGWKAKSDYSILFIIILFCHMIYIACNHNTTRSKLEYIDRTLTSQNDLNSCPRVTWIELTVW